MIGVNVAGVYMAPQNIPSATVLTLGNKAALYFCPLTPASRHSSDGQHGGGRTPGGHQGGLSDLQHLHGALPAPQDPAVCAHLLPPLPGLLPGQRRRQQETGWLPLSHVPTARAYRQARQAAPHLARPGELSWPPATTCRGCPRLTGGVIHWHWNQLNSC